MSKKSSKVVELGEGNGQLFEASVYIDEVFYRFEISQEFTLSESFSNAEMTPGIKYLSGVIHLQNKMVDISGKVLLLKISDNKIWNIAITGGDFINSQYIFVSAPGNDNI